MSLCGYLICTCCLPPQLPKSSVESFQHRLNSHTITFSCPSSSLDSPYQPVFCFCPELMKSVGPFSEASEALFSAPAAPPAPSVPLTHSCSHVFFSSKRGGGRSSKQQEAPPSWDYSVWMSGCLNACKWMCELCFISGDAYLFNYMFSFQGKVAFLLVWVCKFKSQLHISLV